jgi:hypothetical protein
MCPIARELSNTYGHNVDFVVWDQGKGIPTNLDVNAYDVAHFFNIRPAEYFKDDIDIPFGVTIHGFIVGAEQRYIDGINNLEPDWVHVMDSFSQNRLGQYGISTLLTEQVISTAGWSHMPLPTEFAIGYLGGEEGHHREFKRFSVIEAIAKGTDVPCYGHDATKEWISKSEVRALYSKMSIYVNAAWGACGPVTAQEALLCGRPVLTTPIDTMKEVIRPGFDGEFFDGSVEDGVRVLSDMRRNLSRYCSRPPQLNDPLDVAYAFHLQFEKLTYEA